MQEAQAARAAGLAREQQLAAEVAELRQRLEGKLPPDSAAKALQVSEAAAA